MDELISIEKLLADNATALMSTLGLFYALATIAVLNSSKARRHLAVWLATGADYREMKARQNSEARSIRLGQKSKDEARYRDLFGLNGPSVGKQRRIEGQAAIR